VRFSRIRWKRQDQAVPGYVAWRLWTLYGWVPTIFQFVEQTLRKQGQHPAVHGQRSFRHVRAGRQEKQANYQNRGYLAALSTGLQYNYLNETDKTQVVNPYVELLPQRQIPQDGGHMPSRSTYAVGFQSHIGRGADLRGRRHERLAEHARTEPERDRHVAYGYATDGRPTCGNPAIYCQDLSPMTSTDGVPELRFFRAEQRRYFCRVAAQPDNGKVYWFDITGSAKSQNRLAAK